MARWAKKNGPVRCEPWCRHWFRIDGGPVCTYGESDVSTERGAPCLGKKESGAVRNKSDKWTAKEKREWWRKKNSDKRCRANCRHFHDGRCSYGVEDARVEEGAACIGKKETVRKKWADFGEPDF